MRQEISLRAAGLEITSLYLGGGTPSLLSPQQIASILASVSAVASIQTGAEITLEANPGTVGFSYLQEVKGLGVNRLSLGVQSFKDSELRLLGRRHNASEARKAFYEARESGWGNISLDLICGIPGQDVDSFMESLATAIELKPEHISCYSLSLEEGTPLREGTDRGQLPAPQEDTCAYQYELAREMLADTGYNHYELSNWALPGYEGRHNLTYWRRLPYLGIGIAAHSFLNGRRTANTPDMDDYMLAMEQGRLAPQTLDEKIDPQTALAETMFLGLRLGEGVNLEEVGNAFGINVMRHYATDVRNLICMGLLEHEEVYLHLTPRGQLLANEVFWRFLPGERVGERE